MSNKDDMSWFFDALKGIQNLDKPHKHDFEDGHCKICGKTVFQIMGIYK